MGSGVGWVDKAPSAPRLRRSLLNPSYILAQMNPLSNRGLNLRCNFILLYLPQGDFQAYRTPLSGKITLSYRTMSGN